MSKYTTLCYIEKDDCYLMLHRVKKKNDQSRDKWLGVGGHIEEGETPTECALREVKEETGLTLTDYKYRGVVKFVSDIYETEFMCLFTATKFDGEIIECDEGDLVWVKKADLHKLNMWQGDYKFLKELDENENFFTMTLEYEGDSLVKVENSIPSNCQDLKNLL